MQTDIHPQSPDGASPLINMGQTGHALLSASSAKRWLNCPPSARLEEKYPDRFSDYAEEGTTAHYFAETELALCFGLIDWAEYTKRITQIPQMPFYSSEMKEFIEKYKDLCSELFSSLRGALIPKVLLEHKVDYGNYAPGGFGTADCVIFSPERLIIVDLKYGQGVPVYAEDNPQLKLYALGIINEYDWLYSFRTVQTVICQPRLDNISMAEYKVSDLLEWGESIKPIAEQAYEGTGEMKIGSWCRFCKHRLNCKKQMEEAFACAEAPKPETLSMEDLKALLDKREAITGYLSAVEAYALEQVRDKGVKIEGYKLVSARTIRKYADSQKVAECLKKAGYGPEIFKAPELLGISDMEKLLTKTKFREILGDLIIKPEGSPVLVPEGDKRKEYVPLTAEEAFKNIGE